MQCEIGKVSGLCFKSHLQGVNLCVQQPDSNFVWTCQSAHTTINGCEKLWKEGSVTENCFVAANINDRALETKVIPAVKGNNCVVSRCSFVWNALHLCRLRNAFMVTEASWDTAVLGVAMTGTKAIGFFLEWRSFHSISFFKMIFLQYKDNLLNASG